jgi:hypothetical protein
MNRLIIILSIFFSMALFSCGEETRDGQFEHDMEREQTGTKLGDEGVGTDAGPGVGGIAVDTAEVERQRQREGHQDQEQDLEEGANQTENE